MRLFTIAVAIALISAAEVPAVAQATPREPTTANVSAHVEYKTVTIDGLKVFYREAGPRTAPVVLLLHGFSTSPHMFRNLIPALADRFHVVAPDYPGFGNSSMPAPHEFEYTFDNLALVVEKFTMPLGLASYTLHVQDYGAPIGFAWPRNTQTESRRS